MFDRKNVRPFQDFSGSSTFFTVEHFYDHGNIIFKLSALKRLETDKQNGKQKKNKACFVIVSPPNFFFLELKMVLKTTKTTKTPNFWQKKKIRVVSV